MDSKELSLKCLEIRKSILTMVYTSGSGHIGGSFSATELLTVLFYNFLKIDATNPEWQERDFFVLSKGHTTPLYYSILADLGFFAKEELTHFRRLGSFLQGHPDATLISGVEVSTGSLGQGFGGAAGMALALKIDSKPNAVVALLGDGELQEGSIWETAMAVGHFKLCNLLTIVDSNKFQTDGATKDIMNVEPIDEKFKAFGFEPHVINGHNLQEISEAYTYFYETYTTRTKPLVIVANTSKGKGVSFMEGTHEWHGKPPKKEEYEKAMLELEDLQK